MNRSRTIPNRARGWTPSSARTGFTLIEMLMAVTLVLIMMVMFAEVFQMAGGSVTKQRTLADNDQNARTFVTILRADLDKRTFRTVIPFYPGEPHESATPFNNRRGYIYLSTNNSGDGTDDVLQFTVMSTVSQRNSDESPYYGTAAQLQATAWPNQTARFYDFLQNPNQPDRDDGQVIPNGAASSRAAEVSYWMRGGRLYRRVMLIRDPIPAAGTDPTNPAQPKSGGTPSGDYFNPTQAIVPVFLGNFWSQFDFSAFRASRLLNEDYNGNGVLDSGEDLNGNGTLDVIMPAGARFVGLDFLRNDLPPAFPTLLTYNYALGQTWNRFGFNSQFVVNSTANGLSREYSSATAPNFFMGRFTQEETSSTEDANGNNVLDPGEDTPPFGNGNGVLDGFNYPHKLTTYGNGNPMDAAGTTLTDTDSNGVVDQYNGGSRMGVDLLLSNVHEFRVEVWDERLGSFAAMGHNLPVGAPTNPGDYNSSRLLNGTYGPLGGPTVGGVYDTWHPQFDRNLFNGLGDVPDRPPYRPLTWDPTLPTTVTGFPPGPVPGGVYRRGYWAPNTNYSVGDIVFPCREDLNGNGFLDTLLPDGSSEDGSNGFSNDGFLQENVSIFAGSPQGQLTEDLNGNAILDAGEDGSYGLPVNGAIDKFNLRQPTFPTGLTLAYRCTHAGTSGPTRSDEPNQGAWSNSINQQIVGYEDLNGNGSLDLGEDKNLNGVLDLAPNWIVDYNVRPLRAIRITVRYQHPTSQQMKQVSIVHSLRDTTAVP